nr:phosphoenolpyruvate synthase [uncultured Paracoccus sp.]
MLKSPPLVIWFEDLSREDVPKVGGKNASLGEMVAQLSGAGIRVPPGFATSADMFRDFLARNDLTHGMAETLTRLDAGAMTLAEAGRTIRSAIQEAGWPEDARQAILESYRELARRTGVSEPSVAVRSSATAEDLPDASFAGQQETFLNVRGEAALLDACRRCYASLYTDRAITYRRLKGFADDTVALSIGVQHMVRSDLGGAGVMFSIDTESGFDKVVLINAAWGLGETVVQGTVSPDEYQVFKPLLDQSGLVPILEKKLGTKERKLIHGRGAGAATRDVPTSAAERARFVLSDDEILDLARQACVIERHYGRAMDIEWAKDGETGLLYIVQARPETVRSAAGGTFLSYRIGQHGRELLRGLSIGEAVVAGKVCAIESAADIDSFVDGSILITSNTDPDWVPVMKRAAAIVTDHGGRTSHAAIVSRELELPAIVGAGNATQLLHDGQEITVSCAEGEEGIVYEGRADFDVQELDPTSVPKTRTHVMLNLADPAAAFRWWWLPSDGVGLARMEFVITNAVRVHPLALTRFDELRDPAARSEIEELTRGYADKGDYFVDRLARGCRALPPWCTRARPLSG